MAGTWLSSKTEPEPSVGCALGALTCLLVGQEACRAPVGTAASAVCHSSAAAVPQGLVPSDRQTDSSSLRRGLKLCGSCNSPKLPSWRCGRVCRRDEAVRGWQAVEGKRGSQKRGREGKIPCALLGPRQCELLRSPGLHLFTESFHAGYSCGNTDEMQSLCGKVLLLCTKCRSVLENLWGIERGL